MLEDIFNTINRKCYFSDEHTNKDTYNCAASIRDMFHIRLTSFLQHLIDTRVIDCASHDDIMQRWNDFQIVENKF